MFGKYGIHIGVRFLLWTGCFIQPVCLIGLGLLEFVHDKWIFLSISYCLR